LTAGSVRPDRSQRIGDVENRQMLRTPLQIGHHLTLAFEEPFRADEKPVGVDIVEAVLSRQIDVLEPRLMQHGYDVRALFEQFHSKPA
jgi:hypothetical protein